MKRLLSLLLSCLLLLPALSLAQEQKPLFRTAALPEGMSGIYYGLRIEAEGERPMLFHLGGGEGAAGALPPGMKLSESGVLSGTPATPGDYSFTVRATNPAGSSYQSYVLRVAPYDESKLNSGGEEPSIIGERMDSLNGVANGSNGGRVTKQGDNVFFVDQKGYLYEQNLQNDKKPTRLFSALKYGNLVSNAEHLYYYQRYLDREATEKMGENTYVTRIAQDPIVGKGRNTFLSLRWEDFSNLSLNSEVLLFIGFDNVMGRVVLAGKAARDLHMYYAGREIRADRALVFNGKIYFREAGSGFLYEAWLDGELASPLVEEKVLSYTIGRREGAYHLFFADAGKQVHSLPLEGGVRRELSGLRASALNSNEAYLFYADADNKDYLHMMPYDRPQEAVQLSSQAVDEIYAFSDAVAWHREKSGDLWLLRLDTQEEAIRLIK